MNTSFSIFECKTASVENFSATEKIFFVNRILSVASDVKRDSKVDPGHKSNHDIVTLLQAREHANTRFVKVNTFNYAHLLYDKSYL